MSSALRWALFNYTSDKQYTIATSPTSINFSLPPDIAPGEMVNIYPVSFDDLNQIVPAAYQMTINGTMVTVESTMGKVKPNESDRRNLTLLITAMYKSMANLEIHSTLHL